MHVNVAKLKRPAEALRTDAERLTVESARDYLGRLETCQSAPFGRESTSELAGIVVEFAKSEHLE